MNHFQLSHQWTMAQTAELEELHTMCRLELKVGKHTLTQNEDIFSQTISDSVLVSAFPLAHWLASSWWRLLSEPLPSKASCPSSGFRMAHEIAAAGNGYVWPQIVFATDREVMQVWGLPSREGECQSVRYLNGLSTPVALSMAEFESRIENFIVSVIARLDAKNVHRNSLKSLWEEVCVERTDASATAMRRCEAELGYDPDECPTDALISALDVKRRMGDATSSELTPVFGKIGENDSIEQLIALLDSPGITGTPSLPTIVAGEKPRSVYPWQRAVDDARYLRSQMEVSSGPLETSALCDLLGIRLREAEEFRPNKDTKAAIARPLIGGEISLIPRKRHPNGRRFELARFIGDFLQRPDDTPKWLASTDLSTSRQKYQRAFAAEFLCPIEDLQNFLNGDFSEDSLEDAVDYFGISSDTVTSLLANNNLVYRSDAKAALPYAFK
jgi:hypothetical protein